MTPGGAESVAGKENFQKKAHTGGGENSQGRLSIRTLGVMRGREREGKTVKEQRNKYPARKKRPEVTPLGLKDQKGRQFRLGEFS